MKRWGISITHIDWSKSHTEATARSLESRDVVEQQVGSDIASLEDAFGEIQIHQMHIFHEPEGIYGSCWFLYSHDEEA